MFDTKKTLIVVYKDELLMNQLKKMVETHDDGDGVIVGTKDDSIDIVSWTEKVWLDHKKAGTIKGKVLFLGDVKGADKFIPIIDEVFNKHGVVIGWAGNQAIVYADPKKLINREAYDTFLVELSSLPVPSFLKSERDNIVATGSTEDTDITVVADDSHKGPRILKLVKNAISSGADAIERVGAQVASKSEEMFRNKTLMKRQMLFYGVINLYNDWLDKFINS